MTEGIKSKEQDEAESLIAELKQGAEQGLVNIYRLYRAEFFQWAITQYQVNEETCADVFQEAVINLYLQARQGKLDKINCNVKTYLFAIGKNMLLKILAKQKRKTAHTEVLAIQQEQQQESIMELDLRSDRKKMVMQVFEKFGEPCKSILRLFYFNALPMSEIARELNYKNENVVKSQKVRCMGELKRLVKEKLRKF